MLSYNYDYFVLYKYGDADSLYKCRHRYRPVEASEDVVVDDVLTDEEELLGIDPKQ